MVGRYAKCWKRSVNRARIKTAFYMLKKTKKRKETHFDKWTGRAQFTPEEKKKRKKTALLDGHLFR